MSLSFKPMKKKLSTFLREFGPCKGPITHEHAVKLRSSGKNEFILTIVEGSSNNTLWGLPGFHWVNRIEMYETHKAIHQDIVVYDIHFGDEGLPPP